MTARTALRPWIAAAAALGAVVALCAVVLSVVRPWGDSADAPALGAAAGGTAGAATSAPRNRPRAAPPPADPACDAVVELPGDWEVLARRAAGGSLREALATLRSARTSESDVLGLFRHVTTGWGVEGVRAVASDAARGFEVGCDPRRAPLLLAVAHADVELGRTADAGETLAEAVLAMDPDWLADRGSLPRLVAFAAGPNIVPWSAAERAQTTRLPPWMRVLAGPRTPDQHLLDGGSPLVWRDSWHPARDAFVTWLQRTGASDGAPDAAMAATIWLHAVQARNGSVGGLPAAAARRVRGTVVAVDDPSQTAPMWRDLFGMHRSAARGQAWLAALEQVERRVAGCAELGRLDSRCAALAIWSLTDEFEHRFATARTPRADALRSLAARLVASAPEPAADAAASRTPDGSRR